LLQKTQTWPPHEHAGAQCLVVGALGERPAEEAHDLVAVLDDPAGEQQAGTHARGSPRQRVELRREQNGQALLLACHEEVLRETEHPAAPLGRVRRGQPQGVLGQNDRFPRPAARRRPGGRRGDPARKLGIGNVRRERQMHRLQLLVRDDLRELAVELLPLARRRAMHRRCRQQGVRGTYVIPVDDQDAARDSLVERGRIDDCGQLRRTRIGAQGHGKQQLADLRLERDDARPEQVFDHVRDRNVLSRRRKATLREGAPEFDREQRIAAGRLDDPAQKLTGHAQPEPLVEQTARRSQAQRLDVEPLESSPLERPLEWRRRVRAPGQHELHRLSLQPPARERQRLGRRGVQPLDVVHCDEDRFARRQRTQDVEEAERDRARLRRVAPRHGPQQRDLECLHLRGGQRSEALCSDVLEQVG